MLFSQLLQFHMARTQAIFEWIFSADPASYPYRLFYLQSPNVGLSGDALAARQEKETQSVASVRKLSQQYPRLGDVWRFLNSHHTLYTASKLVERAKKSPVDPAVNDLVKKSYGGAQ
jgi:hypothetical protein